MSDHDMFRLRQEMETMNHTIRRLSAEIHSLRVEMGYLRDNTNLHTSQTLEEYKSETIRDC